MELLIRWRKVVLLSVAIALSAVVVWQQCAQAKKRKVSYFPQEYSLDMIEKDYKTGNKSVVLGETYCPSANSAAYDRCLTCEQLRLGCPDCCFENSVPTGDFACDAGKTFKSGTVCTKDVAGGNDSGVPDVPIDKTNGQCGDEEEDIPTFSGKPAQSCSTWASYKGYTEKLCPDKLDPRDSEKCIAGGGGWYCEKDNPKARPACVYAKEKKKCSDINPRYQCTKQTATDVTELVYSYTDPNTNQPQYDSVKVGEKTDCRPGVTQKPTAVPCFLCTPAPAFEKCWKNCQEDARKWENCSWNKACCREDSCGNVVDQATNDKKPLNECPEGVCKKRKTAESGSCSGSTYTSEACKKTIAEYGEWIADGRAVECFKPIDTDFKYRFVGKKNEAITFIWQVFCEPVKKVDEKKFYSMLKIYEVKDLENSSTPNESDRVFYSMIHQKDFSSEFALNAATRFIPNESGKVYNAVVCYFIPPADTADLQMQINDQQIFAVRNRE